MRVCVWGAGTIGRGIARRLVSEPFVSMLHWVNRGESVRGCVVDLKHGLAFAPSCHEVLSYLQADAARAVSRSELVVLTHGVGVTEGSDRASLYPHNRAIMRETVVEVLRGFTGVVLVVTNPVELLARSIAREAVLDRKQVIGLGTLVETARARAARADYLSPSRPARNIPIHAVGTHDEHVVLQLDGDQGLEPEQRGPILERVHHEVTAGAKRVKQFIDGTQCSVVEAAVEVARAVANDSRTLLTVATLDQQDPDGLFYSVPCILGQSGLYERRDDILDPQTREALTGGQEAMRAVLRAHPD
jgi:L-lactate dehydrogenase